MATVRLRGSLICRNNNERAVVIEHLPRHVELTRAEAGCLSFVVEPTADPLVWHVEEEFADADAFAAHQDRVAHSTWGQATAGIRRDYQIDGI